VRLKFSFAGSANERRGIATTGEPPFLLPSIEARGSLYESGDDSIRNWLPVSAATYAMVINELGIKITMSPPIGYAPRADSVV
jgi:hypothetical protein